jgi:hypothetical protein
MASAITGHPLHHLREVELPLGLDAVVGAVAHLAHQRRGLDQRLARHAAVVQAVAAHLVALDQRDLGLDHGGDVARDQARRAGADDDQVAVEALRPALGPAARRPCAPSDHVDDLLGQQREQAEQHEAADQPRREMPFSDSICASCVPAFT